MPANIAFSHESREAILPATGAPSWLAGQRAQAAIRQEREDARTARADAFRAAAARAFESCTPVTIDVEGEPEVTVRMAWPTVLHA